MNTANELLSNPVAIFVGMLVWIPIGIWTMQLMYWMIGGDVDALVGIPGIIVAFGLGFVSMRPPTPQTPYYTLFGLTGTLILFPILRKIMHARELRSIDVEAIERSYEQLTFKINNPSSRFRIAKHLHALGHVGHAIAVAERALLELPVQFFRDEHRAVAQWKAMRHSASSYNPIECVRCGFSNLPGEVLCGRCGGPFLLDRVKGRIVDESLGKRLLIGWSCGVYLLLVIAVWPAIPSPYTAVAAIITALVLAATVYFVLKPEQEST